MLDNKSMVKRLDGMHKEKLEVVKGWFLSHGFQPLSPSLFRNPDTGETILIKVKSSTIHLKYYEWWKGC